MSGLNLSSKVGPLLEKLAMFFALSTAPTAITFSAAAGVPTVYGFGPKFPAATTTTMPSSTTWSHARLRTSLPSDGPMEPRLKLVTVML